MQTSTPSHVSIIPNSRAILDFSEGRFVTVLQALVEGRWQSISIVSSTASTSRNTAETLGRREARELGVPWSDGYRLAPVLAFLAQHSYEYFVGDDDVPRVLIDSWTPGDPTSWLTEIWEVPTLGICREVLGY